MFFNFFLGIFCGKMRCLRGYRSGLYNGGGFGKVFYIRWYKVCYN